MDTTKLIALLAAHGNEAWSADDSSLIVAVPYSDGHHLERIPATLEAVRDLLGY